MWGRGSAVFVQKSTITGHLFARLVVMAKDQEPQWGYFAGIGSVIAVGAALGYFVGHWLDQRYGWHWGAVIGAMLGVSSGMYMLIKDAIKMNKD